MKDSITKVVIDIGTSRVRVVVARFVKTKECSSNEPQAREFIILAVGVVNKTILKNGLVTNIAAASHAIRSAILMAEKNSGLKINSATINVSGDHVFGENQYGRIFLDGKEIRHNDVVFLSEDIKEHATDKHRKLLHLLQKQFIVDEFSHIARPIGMKADQLGLEVHAISALNNVVDSLERSVRYAGIEVEAVIYSGLASGYFATTADERENGVTVIDLGAGTADITIWSEGCPQASLSLPVGGEQVSSDLAIMLKTPRQTAEDLKCQYGSLLYEGKKTVVDVPSTGYRPSRTVPSQEIIEIIRARYQDIFMVISRALRNVGVSLPTSGGIIFTGGASQIPGLCAFAGHHFNCPIRTFEPRSRQGMPDIFQHDPSMTTVLGMLLLYQFEIYDHIWAREEKGGIIGRFFKKFINRYFVTDEE